MCNVEKLLVTTKCLCICTSGNPKKGAAETAGVLVKAITKFLRSKEYDASCTLERIDIVIYQEQHMQAYKDALKKVKEPKAGNAFQRAYKAVRHRAGRKFNFIKPDGKHGLLKNCSP